MKYIFIFTLLQYFSIINVPEYDVVLFVWLLFVNWPIIVEVGNFNVVSNLVFGS